MIENIAAFFKMSFDYLVYIITGFFFATLVFLGYAKLKTGKSWQDIFNLYFQVLLTSLFFTTLLLLSVFILTDYVPMLYIVATLLIVSSVSILFKYVSAAQSAKTMLIDGVLVLANCYFSYLLIMHDRFDIDDYIVLGVVSFCFFLYQQIKQI